MAAPMKQTPLRFCTHCGSKLERKRLPNGDLECLIHFNARMYCGRGCMAKAFEAKPKTSDPSWTTAHWHARKVLPRGPCARCGSKGRTEEVHHKDEDWQNNSPSNLERLCRSCHRLEHSQKQPCVICGAEHKAFGYCEKHYQRFKRHGDPMKLGWGTRGICAISGCLTTNHSHGLCAKHAQQKRRGTPTLR